MNEKVIADNIADWEAIENNMQGLAKSFPNHIKANPENAENGLVKLVLILVELIRKLMERQALRRVDGGHLTEEEIERLGLTLLKLEEKMEELKKLFNLTDEDLTLDLGPIGSFE